MAKAIPAGHPEKPAGEQGRALLERMNAGHHEQLALWGLSHVQIAEDARMLDIGCGGGANLERLLRRAPEGHATGVDYSPLSVEMSRETNADAIRDGRCAVVEGDVSALPFPDESFDLVTAFETLYFWPDPVLSLSQARRVLRPGGTLLVCNEDDGLDPRTVECARQIEGMTVYTAAEMETLLDEAGFDMVEVDDETETGRVAAVARRSEQ